MSNWAQEYLIKEATGMSRLARLIGRFGKSSPFTSGAQPFKPGTPLDVQQAVRGGVGRLRYRMQELAVPYTPLHFRRRATMSRSLVDALKGVPENDMARSYIGRYQRLAAMPSPPL
jgi:hypothetical protein